jgi:very-short-patch-repair endonuclease
MVSQTSGKRVWWLCKSNHEWESTIANRNYHDCQKCTLGNSSKIEQGLYEALKKHYPDATNSARVSSSWTKARYSSVDIMIPSLNLIVEYDGSYWHKNKFKLDTQKTTALIAAGYKVIRVRAKPLEFLDMQDANLVQIVHDKETAGELADMVKGILGKGD